jgi:hypothetical protein
VIVHANNAERVQMRALRALKNAKSMATIIVVSVHSFAARAQNNARKCN